MGDKCAGQARGVRGENGIQFIHVLERAAVGQFAARVHGGAELVVHLPHGAVLLRRHVAFAGGTIARAVAADRIEALERETGRIDLRVARGAARAVAMLVELLAHGRRAARVGVDGAHARRRWWRGFVQQAVHHPQATLHRRGRGAVGGEFQNRGLPKQPTAWAPGGQRHASHLHTMHIRDAVMLGEALVEHRKAGPHQCAHGRIGGDEFAEKRARLGNHRLVQQKAILGVKLRVGRGLVHAAEVEPLVGEVADEAFAARVGEQSVHFAMQHLGALQRAIARGGEQRVIGRAIPQPVGQARGEREEFRVSAGHRFARHVGRVEEKLRRGQHRHVGATHRVLETILRCEPLHHERDVGCDFFRCDRTPEGLGQKRAQQTARVRLGLR